MRISIAIVVHIGTILLNGRDAWSSIINYINTVQHENEFNISC